MATFGGLQSSVADWLNRTDLTSQIKDFINIAIRDIERKPNCNFKYMRNVASGTLTASDHTLALPTRYKKLQAFFVLMSTSEYKKMQKTSLNDALMRYPFLSQLKDFPEVIATDDANSQFILRATPDQAYSYVNYYYAYSAELSADSDSNWLTANYWELVLYGALLQAAPFLGDDPRIATWLGLYENAYKNLKNSEIDEDWGGSTPQMQNDIAV